MSSRSCFLPTYRPLYSQITSLSPEVARQILAVIGFLKEDSKRTMADTAYSLGQPVPTKQLSTILAESFSRSEVLSRLGFHPSGVHVSDIEMTFLYISMALFSYKLLLIIRTCVSPDVPEVLRA
jgi:hypothetical protein